MGGATVAISLVKTGPHMRGGYGPNGRTWSQQARIVKQMDGTDLLRANSGAVTVFRKYFQSQDLNRNGGDVCAEVIAACGGFVPTYIEAYNEIAWAMGGGLEQYTTFMQQFSQYAHNHGYRVAGFSFPETWPMDDGARYIASHGFGYVDAISIHQYWGVLGPLNSGNHAFRYRELHNLWGGSHPPFVITETGRDYINDGQTQQYCNSHGCAGGGSGGIHCCGWKGQGVTAAAYANEIAAYDGAISQDPYCVGAVVFTGGGGSDFGSFEIEEPAGVIVGGVVHECPSGCHWSDAAGGCVNDSDGAACGSHACPGGCHWDVGQGQCVNDSDGAPCGQSICQPGYYWDAATQTCKSSAGEQGITPKQVLIGTALAAGAILVLTYALGGNDDEEEDSSFYGEPPPEGAYGMRLARR